LSDYRSRIHRLIFGVAALCNIAFGIWACFWPGALFTMLEMAPPNYPSLWQCLRMVVGQSGEWPLRALTLIVFNDFVWWLPFTVFLLEKKPSAPALSRCTLRSLAEIG
jgi:hypothetical protein